MPSLGFDALPNQVSSRRCMRGLSFNLLVVGPTGIGKTTLINSLFDLDYGDAPDFERQEKSISLRVKEFRPQNKTIEIKLNLIETKGFGNQLGRTNSHEEIVNYIDARFKDHLNWEYGIQEDCYNDIFDTRVHCCLYMISPIGTGLSALDLITMKALHEKVCLIPVIARCDTLTKHEILAMKDQIKNEIASNGIDIYPSKCHDLPLAVSASNDIMIAESGKRERIRNYPYGRMSIEKDSEFSILRELVLKSSMLSLIETTTNIHYEKFREDQLSSDNLVDFVGPNR